MKVIIRTLDYPAILLREARTLIDRKQYGVSTVVAHMACEIVVQQAFTRAFVKRGIADLEKPVSRLFSGTLSKSNDRLRKVYVALTGDDITKQPFWTEFSESVERRNDCAHRGARGEAADAWDSIRVCTAFVKHVKSLA